MLLATIDASIMLIAMPDVFRGIHLNPLEAGNSFYLLWMILGFLVVSSVLVVSLGSLGDMYGRVRMYNLGFIIYTVASLILAVDWLHGPAGADYLIVFRIVQGIGAAFLLANTGAILTDAFPPNQRGLALGISNVVGISGTFIGLVLGGLLAPIEWRLIFLVSVPAGIVGTIWSYRSLREIGARRPAPIDWKGNLTFGSRADPRDGRHHLRDQAVRLAARWGGTRRSSSAALGVGVLLLVTFAFVELRVEHPMFELRLFRIRAYSTGALATFLSSHLARRADVHADHLAPGDLAAAARLQLRVDAAARGHPDAAAHRGVPDRGADRRASSPTATARAASRPPACSAQRSASRCSRCCRSTSRTPGSPVCSS